MGHAQKAEPKYKKGDIGSICYHAKPSVNDALYQKGTPSSEMRTGIELDQSSGKSEPHHSREEGLPTTYMGKPGQYGHGVEYHALPTNEEHHRAKKQGHWDITSEPNLESWNDAADISHWLKAGEGHSPSAFTHDRGYSAPHATLSKVRNLSHGTSKDTPQPNLYVQDVTFDPNMDYNLVGNAISKATTIEPSGKHYALAKKLKYSPAANDSGASLEEKIEKEHSSEGIGHKVGDAGAEIVDFAMFIAHHH